MRVLNSCSHYVIAFLLTTYFPQSESLKLSEPLAKGCSLVYLDVGSNIGVQVRKLFEPHKYPGAGIAAHFDTYFGGADFRRQASNVTGLCAFGFEANPMWEDRLMIQTSYKAQGWRVEFLEPRIVSDVDDRDITFYIQGEDAETGRKQVTVKTLDLASWMEKEIFPANPKVVLAKMDIEGSEYIVLPKMEKKELLCQKHLNGIMIEWHPLSNPTKTSFRQIKEDLHRQKCTPATHFVGLDDETHMDDGQHLPGNFGNSKIMTSQESNNISKALYKAAHLDFLKRSGLSASKQSKTLERDINELLQSSGMRASA